MTTKMNQFIRILFLSGTLVLNAQENTAQSAKQSTHSSSKKLSVKDIWGTANYASKSVSNFNTLNDGKTFVKLEQNEIVAYDIKTGKKTSTLLSNDACMFQNKPIRIQSFTFSDDQKKVLIKTSNKQLYRHSYESIVYVYDFNTKKMQEVFGGSHCRYATFSPNAQRIAAVINNNLLVEDITNGFQFVVGGDGKPNEIINGAVDWVYEEEFSMSKGFEWSPDGKHIAYLRFDESQVKEFSLESYDGNNYPFIEKYKYPKAGESNSIVGVYLFSFDSQNSTLLIDTQEDDTYIPRIQWATPHMLYIQKLNRHQNHLEILQHNLKNRSTRVIMEEKSNTYIDINNELHFDKTGLNFLFLSERNGAFKQLFNFSTETLQLTALTNNTFDVDAILYYDTDKRIVYYSAPFTGEGIGKIPNDIERGTFNIQVNRAADRHIYKYDLTKKTTEALTNKNGTQPGWYQASFTKSGNFYLQTYSNFVTPPIYTLHDNTGKLIRTLEDNAVLNEKLKELAPIPYQFGNIELNNTISLPYWRMYPPDFDENKKYPILFFVYGGPGSQTVKNAWGGGNYLWHRYLAEQGYIVMSVDNRGTGFNGTTFKKCTYLQLGKIEIEDQIFAAQHMASMPYVDKERIGIWGWSYGGFMSSLGITAGAEVFKTAIAVAPVTDWKFYDNIYTERYMRTPAENPEGYTTHSPIHHISKLKGNYLLIHGTADDNVHHQNAMELIKAMIDKNIEFESEFYPNKNHGIYGGMSRLHLYNRMTRFITEKL